MLLIGLTGKARSGKDTVADFLQTSYSFYRYAFAQPIKQACRSIFEWTPRHTDGDLKDVVDPRYGVSPRHAMQTLGTDWGRNLIVDNLWLRRAEVAIEKYQGKSLVITDVRFDNEAELIRERGGLLIVIERENALDVAQHASENGVTRQPNDIVIKNNGTIEELHKSVEDVIAAYVYDQHVRAAS